jgi:hypothetical protein
LARVEARNGFSEISSHLLNAFADVDARYKMALTMPPGVMAEFVQASLHASKKPFEKFAIAASLAMLSGILGRKDVGLAINLLLIAEAVQASRACWPFGDGSSGRQRKTSPSAVAT